MQMSGSDREGLCFPLEPITITPQKSWPGRCLHLRRHTPAFCIPENMATIKKLERMFLYTLPLKDQWNIPSNTTDPELSVVQLNSPLELFKHVLTKQSQVTESCIQQHNQHISQQPLWIIIVELFHKLVEPFNEMLWILSNSNWVDYVKFKL